MIDLHSHILPGVDDGPGELNQSLELIELYARAGYRTVVATPHWVPGSTPGIDRDSVQNRVQVLNQAIAERGLGVVVVSGMEIALDSQILPNMANDALCPLGDSKTLLIETPFVQFPIGWQELFFQIHSAGYSILLAHPERCRQLSRQPEMLDSLVRCGVYLQVNYESFLGNQGKDAAVMARKLAVEGRIHCLATDSHDCRQRHPGHTAKALAVIEKLMGREGSKTVSEENPERILGGEPLRVPEPTGENTRDWRFWRRGKTGSPI